MSTPTAEELLNEARRTEVEAKLAEAEAGAKVLLLNLEDANTKLAEAQQREAWWRELWRLQDLANDEPHEAELRRLLGLDAAPGGEK